MNKKESKREEIVKSVEKISNSKEFESIGDELGIGLFSIGMALMIFAIVAGTKCDGYLNEQNNVKN